MLHAKPNARLMPERQRRAPEKASVESVQWHTVCVPTAPQDTSVHLAPKRTTCAEQRQEVPQSFVELARRGVSAT